MDSKVLIALCLVIVGVNCQLTVQQIIDQTQYLQLVEKYGTNVTSGIGNIYPQLPNSSDSNFNNQSRANYNQTNGFNNTSSRVSPSSFNSTERFLNRTASSMPKGVCTIEVPTASLMKTNEVVVAGNGSDPSLSRIQVCCEGYQRNIYNFRKCDPICKNECVNGFCSSPDTCVCFPDHVRNLAGFCLPTCPIMCGNGVCNGDNTCTCKTGFTLEPNGKFCVPTCSSGCQNGNCTAPEECTCSKGFSLSSTGRCEPVCSKGCRNGDCVAPDVCHCQKGYATVGDECQPICSRGCLNGNCVAPEVCQCAGHGWSLDSTGSQCVASCDKPCLNGICSGPNQCKCKTGFGLDNFDTFRCVPKCDPPCVNGVCSAPNMCLCYQGFVKDRSVKGIQKCVKA